MQTVYLTRRNLLTLLSKLDRVRAGGQSSCRLGKHDTTHPKFPCSDDIGVYAVEDEAYYIEREAGGVHPAEELALAKEKAKDNIIKNAEKIVDGETRYELAEPVAEYRRLCLFG